MTQRVFGLTAQTHMLLTLTCALCSHLQPGPYAVFP